MCRSNRRQAVIALNEVQEEHILCKTENVLGTLTDVRLIFSLTGKPEQTSIIYFIISQKTEEVNVSAYVSRSAA